MRLTARTLTDWKDARLLANRGRCGLCQLPVRRPVGDHDHATGYMRDVICSGCNAVLGKVENAHRRYGVQNLHAFLHGAGAYLQRHATPQHVELHPTHRTDDEKRIKRNTKARAARAARKVE